MITEKNYITASFIDSERKNIEVLLKNDEETKVYPYILEYNPDNPICKELLEICSLDQIHENTWEKKKEEVKLFEDSIIRIAEKKGLLKTAIKTAKERIKESEKTAKHNIKEAERRNIAHVSSHHEEIVRLEKAEFLKKIKIDRKAEAEEYFNTLFEFLLTNKKEFIDRLFNFKLFLFEKSVVKNSTDEEAKSNIRKAKTPLGAFKEFIKIWEESKKSTN